VIVCVGWYAFVGVVLGVCMGVFVRACLCEAGWVVVCVCVGNCVCLWVCVWVYVWAGVRVCV
jgi:hypothetical protein